MTTLARVTRLAALFAASAAALPTWGAAQTPVYFTSTPDDVTGDNTPVSWAGKINNVTCSAANPCYLPDIGADSYLVDLYERPVGLGGAKNYEYYPQIDIVSSGVGYDDTYLFYRFVLYGGPLDYKYGFEINFDADEVGDLFVEVDDPAAKTGGVWESAHVSAYWDEDQSVGGPRLLLPDGPLVINGYENKIYQTGNNLADGAPGGNEAIVARAVGLTLELAIKRVFLEALLGGPVEKAAFRPLASIIPFNEDNYYIHDDDHRQKIGSPYPWLTSPDAPASCPTAGDPATSAADIAALESGTNVPTAYINPCFPPFQLRQLDVGGTVQDFAEQNFQFWVDMGVSKAAGQDSVSVGDPLTYTLTASNVTEGDGEVTGIVLTDTIPAALSLVSAAPSQGSCSGDPVLVCALGTLSNGDSATVAVVVNGVTLGSVTNRAWVSQNENDTIPANEVDSTAVEVYGGASFVVISGTDTLPRLPSNGTSYAYTFQVYHTYSANKTIVLDAWPDSGPAVLTVDSIRGPAVTAGATADSASLDDRPGLADDEVTVWVSVADVPAGSIDDVNVKGAVLAEPSADTGVVTFRVIRPAIALDKTASPDTEVMPGDDITYTLNLENAGEAEARSVVMVDSLPSQLLFKVGSLTESLPAGVTATPSYSVNNGVDGWAYTPTSGACSAPTGFDGCVSHIRWVVNAPWPDTASASGNEGTLSYVTRVR